MAAPARPPRPQHVMEVHSREQISPTLVRVMVGGEGFSTFTASDRTDSYVKIVFAKPELGLTPPFDLAALRESLPADDIPVTRTYTVRSVDTEARTLTLDFVVHGDEGLAGPWAARAQPGDTVVFMGPGGAYSPNPDADWHLLGGDASALPAIAAALEALPADARGIACIVVDHDDDRLELTHPEGVEIVWAVGADGGAATDLLADTLRGQEWLPGRVHAFVHGERESVKKVRALLKEREVPREDLSISGYWAFGRNEDRFQSEKRTDIGKID